MRTNAPLRAVVIAGPTASGKSALGVQLAEQVGGVVVNADSMQVYRDLDVLTARPSRADLARVEHRLYGHVDGADPYSTGHWVRDVDKVLPTLGNNVPIFVGGTGLYFQALLDGLSPIPAIPDVVRDRWRGSDCTDTTAELFALLAARDPETAASLQPTDRQRIVRALEVFEATGRGLASWQREPRQPLLDAAQTVRVFLDAKRDRLYDRINTRFDMMINDGALDEVRTLAARQLPAELPVMRAHGVPHLMAHLTGDLTYAEAADRSKADVRHYAKRQKTWFRNQMVDWDALDPADDVAIAHWLDRTVQLAA